jgi:hypothetical protein
VATAAIGPNCEARAERGGKGPPAGDGNGGAGPRGPTRQTERRGLEQVPPARVTGLEQVPSRDMKDRAIGGHGRSYASSLLTCVPEISVERVRPPPAPPAYHVDVLEVVVERSGPTDT